MSSLVEFCDWIASTPLSQMIQNSSNIVAGTQTVHILALATVFYLMAVFNLQVIGVLSRPSSPRWTRDPLPWLWWGLATLAVSGVILIIGEPRRELLSWPLRIKIVLIIIATLLTVALSRLDARSAPPLLSRLTAALVLACWVMIIICGRWIAYFNFGEGEGV